MTEHIMTVELEKLSYQDIISTCEKFYNRTGRKLSISFNGSKGYLDNIEFDIECERKFRISIRGQEKIFFFKTNEGEFYIQETK